MSFDPIEWSDKPLQWDEMPEIITHELSCPQWLDYMGMRYSHTTKDAEAHHPVYEKLNWWLMRTSVFSAVVLVARGITASPL